MVVSLHVILTIVCTEPICTGQEGHSIVICRGGEQYTSTYTMYCMHRIHARKRTQQGYLTCRPHIHRRRILCVCMCLGQQDNIITSGPSYASTGWMGANIMTEGTTVADDHHMSLTHSLTHMDMGSPCTCSFDSMSYGTDEDHGEWHAPHHIDRSQVVDASKRAHHGKCVRVAAPLSVFFLRW